MEFLFFRQTREGLRALARAATKGPWEMRQTPGLGTTVTTTASRHDDRFEYPIRDLIATVSPVFVGTSPGADGYAAPDSVLQARANAAFMAAASPDEVLALLDEIERLEGILRVQAMLK